VLPVIPLTIAVIGAKNVESRMKGFTLSLVYVLGIALTYSALGVVFASSGTLLGSQFQSKPFLIIMILIFTLLAFGLFGAYNLQLPAPIRNKLMAKQGKGWFGILFMGLIAGLVASPCAGPIIAAILVFIARTGNILLGFSLMFTFSMGLGLLFLVVGTFSGEIQKLPTGPWMTAVENGLGAALLVVAFYYLSILLDTFAFVLILGITLVVGGVFIGAFTRLGSEDTGWALRLRKAAGVLLVASGLYFFLGGLMTYGLFLPPMSAVGSGALTGGTGAVDAGIASEEAGVVWSDDLEAALFVAGLDGRPVMIDFTADWCVACKELDHFTFSDPAVIEVFRQFILVRVDMTDRSDPKNIELQQQYNILSLPSVTFLTPSGDILPDFTVHGFIRAPEFLTILQGVLDASKNN
jgi:thiol:disulfide interchange protein DsbD